MVLLILMMMKKFLSLQLMPLGVAFMNVKKIFVDIFRAIHRATGRAAITYFQLRRRYLRSP